MELTTKPIQCLRFIQFREHSLPDDIGEHDINKVMGGSHDLVKIFNLTLGLESKYQPQALAFAIAGKKDQALELAMQIETSANANDALFLAEMYTRLNDHDKALEKLELALRLRHPFLPWLELWPGIRPLQNEQRFKQIVLSMNLPD